MVDIWQLDKISDNNQQTWPEGTMEGNQINNAGRDDESLMARWYADWNGTLVTAGTGSAYTVTSNTNRTSYGNDLVLAIRIHTDSLANPTLNVSALGARPWLKNGGDQIQAGDLRADMLVVASYRDGSFYTMSSTYQGSAAAKDVGTAIGNVPEFEDVGGNAAYPANSGEQITKVDPDINGRTAEATIDSATDQLVFYDDSATGNKKASIADIVAAGGGSGGGRIRTEVFTTSGTWNKTTIGSATGIYVEVRAGGGGGGGAPNPGSNAEMSGGGGGGQGERAFKSIDAASLGATETVTVGAGGAANAGAQGGNGGNSSFGAHVSANGGNGAGTFGPSADTTFTMVQGAAGGSGGTGGDLSVPGAAGHPAFGQSGQFSGGVGGGEGGARSAGIGGNRDGVAGQKGGGGSGAINDGPNANRPGGAGGPGYVIVYWVG